MGILRNRSHRAGNVLRDYYALAGIPCLGRRVTAGAAHNKKKKKRYTVAAEAIFALRDRNH